MNKCFSKFNAMMLKVLALTYPLFISLNSAGMLPSDKQKHINLAKLSRLGWEISLYAADKKTRDCIHPVHLKIYWAGWNTSCPEEALERIFQEMSPDFMAGIKSLDLSSNGFQRLPNINAFENLEDINIAGNDFATVPDLTGLKNLKKLALGIQAFEHCSDLKGLPELKEVSIEGYKMIKNSQGNYLPESIDGLISIMEKLIGPEGKKLIETTKLAEREVYNWKTYLKLIDVVAAYFNDSMLKDIRTFYCPVSFYDGLLKRPVRFKRLEKLKHQDTSAQLANSQMIYADEQFNTILAEDDKGEKNKIREQEFLRFLKERATSFSDVCQEIEMCQADKVASLNLKKEPILSDFRKGMSEYITWLIELHVGSLGLEKGYLKEIKKYKFLVPEDYYTLAAVEAMGYEGPCSIVYNEMVMLSHAACDEGVGAYFIGQVLGHEIAGHFRDFVISAIIAQRLERLDLDNEKKATLKKLLSLRNVFTREQEYNADVQGFFSIQDKDKALGLLNLFANNESMLSWNATPRPKDYTAFSAIKNLTGSLGTESSCS